MWPIVVRRGCGSCSYRERRRAEIYALNAIMSESELSQVEIYRKQIEVNTKERPSSFVELGEAFKNKVVGETKIHAV